MTSTEDKIIAFPGVRHDPVPVYAIDGEVVFGGPANPSLTPAAARETAARLNKAADEAEEQQNASADN